MLLTSSSQQAPPQALALSRQLTRQQHPCLEVALRSATGNSWTHWQAPLLPLLLRLGPGRVMDLRLQPMQLLSAIPEECAVGLSLLLEAADVVKATEPYALALAWYLFAWGCELHEQLRLPEVKGVTETNAELLVLSVCCWVCTYVLDRQQALSVSEVAARLALAVADVHGDGTRVTVDTVLELEYRLLTALGGCGRHHLSNFLPLLQRLVRVDSAAPTAAATEGEVAADAGEEAAVPPVSAASGKLPAVPVTDGRGEAAAAEAGAALNAAAGSN